MNFFIKSAATAILGLSAVIGCYAEARDSATIVRPVLSSYTYGVGALSVADTYLTPLTYHGWSMSLGYERLQAMRFNPEEWTMQLSFIFDGGRGQNPARNSVMWLANLNARWSMMHKWQLPCGITVMGGGSTDIDGGVIYNSRNGNNPASAKAAWSVNLTGMAVWKTSVLNVPVNLSYQPALSLFSFFFSPEYDELYYEIYLGNHSGLVHFGWPGNRFRMTNAVMADFHLGSTWLRLGYRGSILSSQASHLTTNVFTHQFVIGISCEWLSADNCRKRDVKTISAY